ncbi:MAG: glycine--tRNA ligase subunit beta [Gammaproteobacteria bacterium]|nr:glycine--tRNA ligase subunit beta [Gammaproteobacteria bacterium]
MRHADFLVEIGVEELPPKSLRSLMDTFAENMKLAVDDARLAHGDIHGYASPRRLAVIIEALAKTQEDRKVSHKGPPVSVAFDSDGKPQPAAKAFAKKCGVAVSKLERSKTNKGEWLSYDAIEKGSSADELIGGLVEKALAGLPIPRRMRWGAGEAEFVRPVHWIVLLHGKKVVKASVMGVTAGNKSRGHRFLSEGAIKISEPGNYLQTLDNEGHVIADFARRRELVVSGVAAAAKKAGGEIVDGESLYDEVTALVEWPVPVLGSFDPAFLALPRETVISTLSAHQRYFPIADKNGTLLPKFVTVANIKSREPAQVRNGNERVIRPRLADAAFFWDNDRRRSLESRQEALHEVVYQQGLGSLHDKSARIASLAQTIAGLLGVASDNVGRAAILCKCDLLTGMVGEFPELQGVMGRYYADTDGEPAAVAKAIGEHYRPRFAGDALPASIDGQILSVADKLDSLAGVFAIGKRPSGNRDPFGLRRAALGVIRILVECELDIDLNAMIDTAVNSQPPFSGSRTGKLEPGEVAAELTSFVADRLRRYFLDRDAGLATETFDAVLARSPSSLVDFDNRLRAVQAFLELDEAASLASANKRIANILRQADAGEAPAVKQKLLSDDAEQALFAAMRKSAETLRPLLEARRYTEALSALAGLRGPVDKFFDDVMVMTDDKAVRNNRLALLGELRALFLDVADISRLAIA